jgi:hypothetical protein
VDGVDTIRPGLVQVEDPIQVNLDQEEAERLQRAAQAKVEIVPPVEP